jgi:hypothetical protein
MKNSKLNKKVPGAGFKVIVHIPFLKIMETFGVVKFDHMDLGLL